MRSSDAGCRWSDEDRQRRLLHSRYVRSSRRHDDYRVVGADQVRRLGSCKLESSGDAATRLIWSTQRTSERAANDGGDRDRGDQAFGPGRRPGGGLFRGSRQEDAGDDQVQSAVSQVCLSRQAGRARSGTVARQPVFPGSRRVGRRSALIACTCSAGTTFGSACSSTSWRPTRHRGRRAGRLRLLRPGSQQQVFRRRAAQEARCADRALRSTIPPLKTPGAETSSTRTSPCSSGCRPPRTCIIPTRRACSSTSGA